MTVFNVLQNMLKEVAKALGPDMCRQMTFVGGCTTGLLLTDDFTREQVRSTEDVDLIVHVLGPIEFGRLQERLYERGFRLSPAEIESSKISQLGQAKTYKKRTKTYKS